jgi:hypothetical protein
MCKIRPLRKIAGMLFTTAIVLTVGTAIGIATGMVDPKKLHSTANKGTDVKNAAIDTAAAAKEIVTNVVNITAEKAGTVADKGGELVAAASEAVTVCSVSSPVRTVCSSGIGNVFAAAVTAVAEGAGDQCHPCNC